MMLTYLACMEHKFYKYPVGNCIECSENVRKFKGESMEKKETTYYTRTESEKTREATTETNPEAYEGVPTWAIGGCV